MIPRKVRGVIATEDGRDVFFEIEGSEEYMAEHLGHVGDLALLRYATKQDGSVTYRFKEGGPSGD